MNYLIRLTLLLSLLWMWKDDKSYLYPGFNLYFTFGMVAIALFLMSTFYIIRRRTRFPFIPIGTQEILFLFWMAYIGMYPLFFPSEQYNILYLLCSGLYYMACVLCFRTGCFTRKGLGFTLIAVAGVESIICWLQYMGRIPSRSTLFSVTGTSNDPNLTTMLLALAVPFVYYYVLHTPRHCKKLGVLLLLLLSTLILLKCRTAYLSVFFSLLYITLKETIWGERIQKLPLIHKLTVWIITGLFLSALSFGLYFYKQNSADGRLFIWKVSTAMIQEKPLFGYGYGLFEKSYNEWQAVELQKQGTTATEKKNARMTLLAFNDFIEQTVNGGLVGGVLFLLIVLSAVRRSFRQKDSCITACCTGVLVFMLVNFVVQSVTVWMAALTLFACVSKKQTKEDVRVYKKKPYTLIVLSALLLCSLFCGYRITGMCMAQKKLKEAMTLYKHSPASALTLLQDYLPYASTSECYLRNYAKLLINEGYYEQAQSLLDEAAHYSSHPSIRKQQERIKTLRKVE